MGGINTVFIRALLASGAFGAAVLAGQGEVGLFHQLDWPWWDRVLGTYLSQPGQGHEHMMIGLEQYRDPIRLTWLRLMALPFSGKLGNYPTWHDEQNQGIAENRE
jgi:hypothetical protein